MAKFCHNCGAKLPDDSVFCTDCGAKQIEVAPAAPQQPASQQEVSPQPTPQKPKKKKTGMIAGIVAAVLVIAAALTTAFWLYPNYLSRDARYEKALSQANAYLSAEDYASARDAYTKAISLNKTATDPLIGRGDAYVGLEQYDDAIADYEAAIALDGTLATAYLRLADAYVANGDEDSAIEVLRDGIDATDGDKKLQARLDELDSPLSALSGVLADVVDLVEREAGDWIGIDSATASSLLSATENTMNAVADLADGSPYGVVGDLISALMQGEITGTLNLHDESNYADLSVDLRTNLSLPAIAASASVNYNGESASGDVYLDDTYGAFHSDLIDGNWYGATWATLLDDLENSIFVDRDIISTDDIDELRDGMDEVTAMLSELDLSGLNDIDLEQYLRVLFSVQPTFSTGSGEYGDFVSMEVPLAAYLDVACDLLDTLADDQTAASLISDLVSMEDPSESFTVSEWADELHELADELRDEMADYDISGSMTITAWMNGGYLTKITCTADPSVDGDSASIEMTLSFEFDGSDLYGVSFRVDAAEYGDTATVAVGWAASESGNTRTDTLTLRYDDGYDYLDGSLTTEWARGTGDLTITVWGDDGYSSEGGSFSLNLLRSSSGSTVTLDTASLFGVDGELKFTANAGSVNLGEPSRFVNLDEWDDDFLNSLQEAAETLEDIFG
jgi:tetratricopeptide (TPR) repeat protein